MLSTCRINNPTETRNDLTIYNIEDNRQDILRFGWNWSWNVDSSDHGYSRKLTWTASEEDSSRTVRGHVTKICPEETSTSKADRGEGLHYTNDATMCWLQRNVARKPTRRRVREWERRRAKTGISQPRKINRVGGPRRRS